MPKKRTPVISLVDEADGKTCEEIAEDIREELRTSFRVIASWAKEIEKFTVTEG